MCFERIFVNCYNELFLFMSIFYVFDTFSNITYIVFNRLIKQKDICRKKKTKN